MTTPSLHLLRFGAASVVLAYLAGCSPEDRKTRHLSRAEEYFKAGEYEKAKIEFANVLKLEPQNLVAIRYTGLIWAEQGAPLRAIPYLAAARDRNKEDQQVRIKLMSTLVGWRQYPEARREALEVLQNWPGQREAVLVLSDTARSDEEIREAEKAADAAGEGSPLKHLVAANAALQKKNFNAAQASLERAIAGEPNSATPYLAMGNLRLLRGNREEAAVSYRKAGELSPVRTGTHLKYGEFLLQTGKYPEAAAWIDGVTKVAPDYIPAWNVRGQIALSQNKPDEALQVAQRVAALDAGNFEARLTEGQARLLKNEIPQALKILEDLDKAYGNIPGVKYHLARAHVLSGNASQAKTVLAQAVSLNPDYTEAILFLAELDLRAGDDGAVIDAMNSLLRKRPDLGQAHLYLAEAYRRAGRFDDAAGALNRVIASDPDRPELLLLLGLVLRQQGKGAEARDVFERANKLAPKSLLPISYLVDMEIKEGKPAEALVRVEERLKADANDPALHYLKARVHALQKDWDKAEAALKTAIELSPDFVSSYDFLAGVYVSSGRIPQAIAQINEAITKDPKNTRALMIAGAVYTQAKEYEEARIAYEKLLAIRPDFSPALNNLAWLYSEHLHQLDKAMEIITKARSLQPADAAIADTYGWILYRQGKYDQALTVLRDASSKLSDNPEVSYHLGMAAYTMGEKELARQALEAAAKAPESFPGKENISARLTFLAGSAEGQGKKSSLDELKKLIEQNPHDTLAWIELGAAHEALGAPAEAAGAYEKALAVNPKLVSALLRLAKLNTTSLGNPAKGMELARTARNLAPHDVSVAQVAGSIALEAGSPAWAHTLLEEAARKKPDEPAVAYDLACAAYALGRVRESADTMRRVVAAERSPWAAEAQTFLRYVAPERPEDSPTVEEAEGALKKDRLFVPAKMRLADAAEQKGELQSAITLYGDVLAKLPTFAPAQKRLAALYMDNPETAEKAHNLAMEARKTLKDDPELSRILGIMSYKRGEFAYAAQQLGESAKASPLKAREMFYLGVARWKQKSEAGAKEALQAALSAGLEEPLAAEARTALQELERQPR